METVIYSIVYLAGELPCLQLGMITMSSMWNRNCVHNNIWAFTVRINNITRNCEMIWDRVSTTASVKFPFMFLRCNVTYTVFFKISENSLCMDYVKLLASSVKNPVFFHPWINYCESISLWKSILDTIILFLALFFALK